MRKTKNRGVIHSIDIIHPELQGNKDEEFFEETSTGSHEEDSIKEEAARWIEAMHQTPLDDEAISKAIMDFCMQTTPARSSEDNQMSSMKQLPDQGKERAEKPEDDQSSETESESEAKGLICNLKDKAGNLKVNSLSQQDLHQLIFLYQGSGSIMEAAKGKQLIPQESVTVSFEGKWVEKKKDKIEEALKEIAKLREMLEERQERISLMSVKDIQDLSLSFNQWRQPQKWPEAILSEIFYSDEGREESVRNRSNNVRWIKGFEEGQRPLLMQSRFKLVQERLQL